METVDEHARHVRRKAEISAASEESSRGHREELAILYGMAENEAIGELCNLLDEASYERLPMDTAHEIVCA